MKTVFLKGLCGLSLVMIPEAVLSSSKDNLRSVSPHQYTHLIETYQSQTFEPMSQTALFSEQSASVSSFVKEAKVHFLTNDGKVTFKAPEFPDMAAKCYSEGFTKTTTLQRITVNNVPRITTPCSGNLADACPYDSSMFKTCCSTEYKYTECPSPQTSVGSCGGKYKCECDKSLFPKKASDCVSPMTPALGTGSLDRCVENGVTYVSECVCPSNYTETCSGNNLQGKGVGCSKNGVTKYTGCECKPGYTLTCSENGSLPLNPNDYCLSPVNNVKLYKNCKPCPNECKLDSCPKGTICQKEECSKKYCAIGCEKPTYIGWCKQPETDCAKLGYTQTAKDCEIYGYIKCPYSETAVFCDND